MVTLRRLLARLRGFVTNQRQDDDFSEELQSHIDLLAAEMQRAAWSVQPTSHTSP